MRITTKAVYQMTDDGFIELERDSYEYDGQVSMAKGGDTVEQTNEPWGPLQDPLLNDTLPKYLKEVNNPAKYYPRKTYAGFDPAQQSAQTGMLQYAGGDQLNNAIGNQFGALNFGLNSVYDPQSNPVINDYVNSAIRPLSQAYQEQVGNAIAGNAAGAGGLGGSRQGVAEGLASRSYLDAVGDTSTNIYNNAYNQGLDQQAKMLAMAPQVMQAGMMPQQIQQMVGGQRQAMDQNKIDYNVNRYNYNKNIDYDRLRTMFNDLMGSPFGTTTGPDPNASNSFGSAAGGALAGAATGAQLGSVVPGIGTAIGAGGGALLGGLAGWL